MFNYHKQLLRKTMLAVVPALLLGVAQPTFALGITAAGDGAVLAYGNTYLGVNDLGHLNVWDPDGPDGAGTYGLWRDGLGDATSPGCLCEGWGVAVTTAAGRQAGFANEALGTAGLTGGTFGATTIAATSTVGLTGAPVTVTHAYGLSLANEVFQGQVTITNTGDTTLSDVVYRRVMDWDIPPTEFSEYVTHGGVEANLESAGGNVRYASDNGFASSDPRISADSITTGTINSDFTDSGPKDHGSVFDFAFGDLAAGESRTFNIFYGSAANEADALNAISILGADVYSLGQQAGDAAGGTPATFLFAFGGVGGVEPGGSAEEPVLPFVPAPGQFEFPAPISGRWFDPPFVEGFEYVLEGTDPTLAFTMVGVPPASFGFGSLEVVVGGVVVAVLAAGETFDFVAAGLTDVTTFRIMGIDPLLDEADPGFTTAFPTYLDWTGTASTLLMSSIEVGPADVPEPASLALMGLGLVGLAAARRRRRLH